MIPHFFDAHKYSRFFSKELAIRLITPGIVVVVGLGSFGLGRLSALGEESALVAHQAEHTNFPATSTPAQTVAAAQVSASQTTVAHTFVASQNGTKYYPADCIAANRINETNKVWFATESDAQSAGYSRASNCKF